MKKIIFLSLLLGFSASLFSQDFIFTTDGERIEAKILTVHEAVIDYTLFDDPSGLTYFIKKSNLKSITYENGEVENFDDSNNPTEKKAKTTLTDEKIFKNVIRIMPFATIIGAIGGYLDIDLQYARYLTPKVAIPLALNIASANGQTGVAIMTGIEVVPLTHRQKSGLFLDALAGIVVLEGVGFIVNPNIGYQIMTKKGFVFTGAIGPEYNSLTDNWRFRFILGFGIAF